MAATIKQNIGTVAAGLGGALLSLYPLTAVSDWWYCTYLAFSDSMCPASGWSYVLEARVALPLTLIVLAAVGLRVWHPKLLCKFLTWWLVFTAVLYGLFILQGPALP